MNERGAILAICLLAMAALLLLGSALIVLTQSSYISAGVERDEKRAFYTAFAGVERAIHELNQDGDWSDATPLSNLYTDESLNYEAGAAAYTGSYTVVLKNRSEKDVRIESTGEANNSKRKISVRVTR
jgi:Tfp pilus assembly protein PilX